ncbi:substrate-binding domain-containing protein [Rhodococcus sp. 114MFTsu3.1]|uniref:substrate-binding domain-containing protein n=1 Tax=Rhodococcus sp. 114MFTsu3.1 TaxID=1172184 RepID=UPI00039F7464|nr:MULTISPECIES: substrate-binding domain-containing protein [unclassified Rhodococcus (in: high G+C Gram-positive bacteria)]
MGEHRTSGGSRGVSKGPVVAAGTILVVVLAVFGWFQLRDRIADQGTEAADTCVEGPAVVPIVVDPDISSQVTQLAAAFTDSSPVVRDHCVSLEVSTHDSAVVGPALAAGESAWDAAALGPQPALWIPRSSDSVADLPAGAVNGTPRSVASSPVVLAAPIAVADALEAADIGWADIPRLQAASDGLDAIGLPGWGGLRLLLPLGPESDASTAALRAVAATTYDSSVYDESGVASADVARSAPTVSAMSALATTDLGTPSTTSDSTDSALARLSADTSPTADAHTVPVSARQLTASSQSGVTAFTPRGDGPVFDHPAVVLAGAWTDDTASRAAAQFVDFMSGPDNTSVFSDAGFDVAARSPASLPPQNTEFGRTLVDAVLEPATPRRVTTLLDASGSMDTAEGSETRLQNTVAALDRQFDSVVDTTELGLWIYSKDLDGTRAFRTLVPTGPVEEVLGSETRRERLLAEAAAVRPATATSTYESVLAVYLDALSTYVPGKPNSVVLITDGPNDDPTISASRFLEMVSDLIDPERPVAVDVVAIGTNPDSSTLQSVSDATGGSFNTVASSDGEELPDLLRKLLY